LLSLHSGLGYILGSIAKDAGGDWYWALRVRAVKMFSYVVSIF